MSSLDFNIDDVWEKSLNNVKATILSDRDKKEVNSALAEELKYNELAKMQDEIRKVRMG